MVASTEPVTTPAIFHSAGSKWKVRCLKIVLNDCRRCSLTLEWLPAGRRKT